MLEAIALSFIVGAASMCYHQNYSGAGAATHTFLALAINSKATKPSHADWKKALQKNDGVIIHTTYSQPGTTANFTFEKNNDHVAIESTISTKTTKYAEDEEEWQELLEVEKRMKGAFEHASDQFSQCDAKSDTQLNPKSKTVSVTSNIHCTCNMNMQEFMKLIGSQRTINEIEKK